MVLRLSALEPTVIRQTGGWLSWVKTEDLSVFMCGKVLRDAEGGVCGGL